MTVLGAAAATAEATGATACSDFDTYVNGRWHDSTELPAARSRIGSFDTLRVANDKLLETALAELATQPSLQTTPGLKLLASYYRSGMDLQAIERSGLAPVAALMARIDGVGREGLPLLLAELARLQIDAPLTLGVTLDAKDVRRHVLALGQGGLGLPDRGDYMKTDTVTTRIKAAYRTHARKLLEAARADTTMGRADSKVDDARLDALLAFEAELADAS
ncbi:MAG: hypothetical protein H7Z19_05265, partial [Chitinophagaceae bacterium]|nr:hypothetical protein [Rubrivivax sp.]